MTAKADTALRYARFAGIALLCLLPAAAFAKDGPYLTWRAKAAPVQQAGSPQPVQAPQVPVPPSPYGQVGDPYMHVLTWTAKSGATPQPVASAVPVRRAPVQQMQAQPAPQMREPVQATAPAMSEPAYQPSRENQNYRTQAPQYRAQPMASTLPEPVQDEPTQVPQRQALPSIAAQTQQMPQPAPQPVRQPAQRIVAPPKAQTQAQTQAQAQPQARPLAQPTRATPAPQQPPVATATNDGAYQVPANSPYAARIAAARAAQEKTQAKAQAQAAAAPAKPAGKDAPAQPAVQPSDAPVTETASDDDKPFVPGQHYTDASEAPRLYSLHRDYGLKPDPITVDTNASGAVLDTSKLDAAEAKAAKDEKADEDAAGDDPETDGVTKTSSSASATQKASAGKTNKADQ